MYGAACLSPSLTFVQLVYRDILGIRITLEMNLICSVVDQ